MSPETLASIDTPIGRVSFHSSAAFEGGRTALLWPSLFTTGHATWQLQLETLRELGFRTIVVDPPGQGASGRPPPRFSIRHCSEAALRILDSQNVESAAFLGVSWGGFVAMQTAIVTPDRVTSLVLSNTTASRMSAVERFRDGLIAKLLGAGVPGSAGRLIMPGLLGAEARRKDPAFAARMVEAIDGLDKVSLARSVRSVLAKREDLTSELHRIRAPTLVVAGASDTALPPKHSEFIARHIAGARYEVISDVAHLAPREAPSEFAALLKSFLGSSRLPTSLAHSRPA